MGRLTSLHRFLSKHEEKALPFFKILRRCGEERKVYECRRSFEELRAFLRSLPLLTLFIHRERDISVPGSIR